MNKNTEANTVPAGGSDKDDAENEGDSDDDRDDEQTGGPAEVNGSFHCSHPHETLGGKQCTKVDILL